MCFAIRTGIDRNENNQDLSPINQQGPTHVKRVLILEKDRLTI